MILKEYRARATDDPLRRAGDAAERQMAHYLRRAFGEHPGIWVFHGLRVERQGEIAQIDHLLLHRAGMVVIESKSVTSQVRINARQEWSRRWNGDWVGMASPVLQAERQGALLRQLLDDHSARLRRRVLGLQGRFGAFPFDPLVAISDGGIIEHAGALPHVRKADQVPRRARKLIDGQRRLANPLNTSRRAWGEGQRLAQAELERVRDFLLESDLGPPDAAWRCRHCQGSDLQIAYANNYYFRCRTCRGNTPIRLKCRRCGGGEKTRKAGDDFYRECPACAASERYFQNPSLSGER